MVKAERFVEESDRERDKVLTCRGPCQVAMPQLRFIV